MSVRSLHDVMDISYATSSALAAQDKIIADVRGEIWRRVSQRDRYLQETAQAARMEIYDD
jgi:hypothetical protein